MKMLHQLRLANAHINPVRYGALTLIAVPLIIFHAPFWVTLLVAVSIGYIASRWVSDLHDK